MIPSFSARARRIGLPAIFATLASGGFLLAGCTSETVVVRHRHAPPPPARVEVVETVQPAPQTVVVEQAPAPQAQVIVQVAPPPPRREVIVVRPSPNHILIKGYWAWRGGRHVWVASHWELPPRAGAHWVEPRWEHRGSNYIFIEGSWR